ncbi:hypothetical protein ACSQ8M_01420 [Marinovum sp. B10]|jgi:hypothetical protein
MPLRKLGDRRNICVRAQAGARAGCDDILIEGSGDRERASKIENQVVEPISNPIATGNHDEAGWRPVSVDQDISPAWIGCTGTGKQFPRVCVSTARNLGIDVFQRLWFARDQDIWAECGEVA